jgi:hypothetical protein
MQKFCLLLFPIQCHLENWRVLKAENIPLCQRVFKKIHCENRIYFYLLYFISKSNRMHFVQRTHNNLGLNIALLTF